MSWPEALVYTASICAIPGMIVGIAFAARDRRK